MTVWVCVRGAVRDIKSSTVDAYKDRLEATWKPFLVPVEIEVKNLSLSFLSFQLMIVQTSCQKQKQPG